MASDAESQVRKYIHEPMYTFIEFVEEVDRVLHLSMTAIRRMEGSGHLAEVIYSDEVARSVKKEVPADAAQRIKAAKELEALAMHEVKDGFPLLIAHSTVAVWSALESTIPRFVARWIGAYPAVLKTEAFQRIKLPVTLFGGEHEDLMTEIVAEIDRSTASSLKAGAGRFEALLSAVGCGGAPDDELRRDLYELSKVRNLIVHQFSIVDAEFAKSCPWIKTAIGSRLRLSYADYDRYRRAAREYCARVVERSARNEPTVGRIPD